MANENSFKPESSDNSSFPEGSNEGPQFGLDQKEGWLSKYGSSIVLPIIAILILAGGIYLYATQKEESVELTEKENGSSEEIINLEEEFAASEEEITISSEESEEAISEKETIEEIVPEIRETNGSIAIRANKGEGITHLARRALKEYLKDNPQTNLTNEHKVYIEDYLQNKTGNRALAVNEEISFSDDLIQEAISGSSQLNQTQLNGLQQYSALVAW